MKNKGESSSAKVERKIKEIAACFEEQDYDYYLPGVLNELGGLLEIQPDNPLIYFWLGRTYEGLEEIDQSNIQYEKAIELKPDYSDAYLFLAENYQDDNRGKSVEILQKVISFDPACIQAWSGILGWLKYKQKPTEVKEHIEQLLSKNPNNPDAYIAAARASMANYVFEKSDDPVALDYFNRAILLCPNEADYYYARYFVLFRMGKYEEALADLDMQKTLKTNTILDDAYIDTYKALKAYDKAIGLITKLLETSYEPYFLYYQRAMVHKEKEQYKNALKDINTAIRKVPKYDSGWKVNFYAERADIHYKNNKTTLALKSINKAIEQSEHHTSSLDFSLQKVNILMDADKEKALKILTELEVNHKSDFKMYPMYMERMEELKTKILTTQ